MPRARCRRVFGRGKLKGGTLTWASLGARDPQYNRFAGVEQESEHEGSPDTLLGPEGTGTSPRAGFVRLGHSDVEPLDRDSGDEQATHQEWNPPEC